MFAIRATAFVLVTCCCTVPLGAQQSHWKQEAKTDYLTNKKSIRFRNDALQTFVQFGRPVSVSLYLYCLQQTQIHALIYFSEPVGIEVSARFRFDDGEVKTDSFQLFDNGQQTNFGGDILLPLLLRSSRLRMEWNLPWAKVVHFEFDTRGVQEARKKLPC